MCLNPAPEERPTSSDLAEKLLLIEEARVAALIFAINKILEPAEPPQPVQDWEEPYSI
jgi:hypothetical protein